MTPAGLLQLQQDEGCEERLLSGLLTSYPDPLSPLAVARRDFEKGDIPSIPAGLSGEPWTIGYGCTGPGIVEGTTWTQAEADNNLFARVAALQDELPPRLGFWSDLAPARQDVLINMAYNMGLAGLMKFPAMIGRLSDDDYPGAAREMLDSLWATQVPARAKRLADVMISGAWPA